MSNSAGSGRSTDARDEVFGALADGVRRELLRIVRERSPAGIAKTDLAVELAAALADKPLVAVSDDEYQRALVDCHHRTLPALLDVGLLEETEAGTVVATDHRALADPEIEAVVSDRGTDYGADLDAVLAALADARRRTVLSELETKSQPLSTETLARAVAAREAGTTVRDVSEDRVEAVVTSLVHIHLPRLRDAGLIGYDAEVDRVSADGDRLPWAGWFEDEHERGRSLGNRAATS
ncbi:DUF7344 domain-containing protein [Natronorubrum halophilum]|uniref:DUF7344 domain-containing protein n=1 Tax=Natronorubrum halophilum TaxID=1702106 RepID=UPI001EE88B63|nr:hypothetical protein [Natronorubrum halophilum]